MAAADNARADTLAVQQTALGRMAQTAIYVRRISGSFRDDRSDECCFAVEGGGARRDRTADLLHAMQALSQLSYGPKQESVISHRQTGAV
jgi:hypothetical protein